MKFDNKPGPLDHLLRDIPCNDVKAAVEKFGGIHKTAQFLDWEFEGELVEFIKMGWLPEEQAIRLGHATGYAPEVLRERVFGDQYGYLPKKFRRELKALNKRKV